MTDDPLIKAKYNLADKLLNIVCKLHDWDREEMRMLGMRMMRKELVALQKVDDLEKIFKETYGKRCRSFLFDCWICRGYMALDILREMFSCNLPHDHIKRKKTEVDSILRPIKKKRKYSKKQTNLTKYK